jgi:hypothetical protein
MFSLRNEKIYWYVATRDVENFSGFLLITMAFDKFSRFNGIHMVKFTVWKEFYIHANKNKVNLFSEIDEK